MSANNIVSPIYSWPQQLVVANLFNKGGHPMMTKIRPLHDRVVVKRLDAENKSAGGNGIPHTRGEKPGPGAVVAAGKGKIPEDGKGRPPAVKVGDRIPFGNTSRQRRKRVCT